MYPVWREKLHWLQVWRRARGPFALPCRLTGHDCSPHWERVDIDIAGCRLCGRGHFCSVVPTDAAEVRRPFNRSATVTRYENVDCDCPTQRCDNHVVCEITGFCVSSQTFSELEYVDTSAPPPPVAPRVLAISHEETAAYVRRVLCGTESRGCLQHENARVDAKVRHLFLRVLREEKGRCRGRLPDICRVVATLVHRTQNIRMCSPSFDVAHRELVATRCCQAVFRMLCALHTLCPALLSQTKRETLVVGLLYLMRSGLLVHNTFLLPRVAELQTLLPLESYLYPYFAIKCKSITEIENLVKMQVRSLSVEQVHRLGADAIDVRL